jgi:hypothetical protein
LGLGLPAGFECATTSPYKFGSLLVNCRMAESRSSAERAPTVDVLALLKAVVEAGAALVPLGFSAGWSYMASYYNAFGLNPMELDFSVAATCVFAAHMIGNAGWWFSIVAVGIAALMFILRRVKASATWTAGGIAFLLIVAMVVGTVRGRAVAREDMFETSRRLPTVSFATKSRPSEPSCVANGTADCKLLLHVKGAYYFFEPIAPDAETVAFRNVNVYIVPESEVVAVHLQRGLE